MSDITSDKYEPKTSYLNWKVPLSIGIFATLFMGYFLIYIKDSLNNKYNNDTFKNMYNIFIVILLLNIVMATYTVSLFYFRINKQGMKGAKGRYGKNGVKGKDTKCDLFSKKTKKFSLKQDIKVEPYEVDTNKVDISNYTVNVDNQFTPKWKRMYTDDDNPVKDNFLGSKFTSCLEDKSSGCSFENSKNVNAYADAEKNNNYRPFTGALANYELNKDSNEGMLNSLQFTYNEDDNDNYSKIKLVGNKLGLSENKGDEDNFKCPKNSAIYKIETLHDEDRKTNDGIDYGTIKGIKFKCKDINTGDTVKILDSNNNLVDNVSFGVNPDPTNDKYTYNSIECGNKEIDGQVFPGFVSNYTALHSDTHGINTIAINQCSYYDNIDK